MSIINFCFCVVHLCVLVKCDIYCVNFVATITMMLVISNRGTESQVVYFVFDNG